MSKDQNALALLPNGFVDLLPEEAEAEARAIRILMEKFTAFGYQRIKPPLLEFEDSLLAPGPGERLASETFRLMDPVSHRMLGVRSDITPQIVRIASSRLAGEHRPLRITYANDVLRTRASQMRTERQFCQVGCEIIGNNISPDTDVEIATLAVLGLKKLGLGGLTIDFTIPHFISCLIKDVADDDVRDIVAKAVAQRDEAALRKTGLESAQKIVAVMMASGPYQKAFEVLKSIALPEDIARDILALEQICKDLARALEELGYDDVAISIDVLEQEGFEYHKQFGFTIFSAQIHGELGRGGCYDVRFGKMEQTEIAKGFTLYMDSVRKIAPPSPRAKKVFVPAQESWATLRNLQDQGWIVVRGCGKGDQPLECDYIYSNGRVEERT